MRYPGPDSAVLAWYRARGAALSAKSLAIGQSGREYAFRCANRKCRRSGTREQALGKKGVVLERKNVFIRKVSGGAAIFRRVGRGRPRLLYFLTPQSARIEERFDFRSTARDVARRVYKREFGRAFAKALATRKR